METDDVNKAINTAHPLPIDIEQQEQSFNKYFGSIIHAGIRESCGDMNAMTRKFEFIMAKEWRAEEVAAIFGVDLPEFWEITAKNGVKYSHHGTNHLGYSFQDIIEYFKKQYDAAASGDWRNRPYHDRVTMI